MWWLFAARVLLGALLFGLAGGILAIVTGLGGAAALVKLLDWMDARFARRHYQQLEGPCPTREEGERPRTGIVYCTTHRMTYTSGLCPAAERSNT